VSLQSPTPTESHDEGPASIVPPSLPPVPRPITHRARRRSWAEMPVRVWMILTLLVAIVTVYFTVTQVRQARRDRWLIEHGVDVVAKFTMVNGDPVPKRRPRNEPLPLSTAKFTLNGREYELKIDRLEAKPGTYAMVGSDEHALRIKVDPNDPTGRWTEQTQPRPWSQELTAVGFLAPLLVLLFIVMLWKRRGVLKAWSGDPLTPAVVVETRHTATAPMSRVIRFTLRDGADRRIWHTLMPTAAGIPQQGETIWLICPPNNPGRAIVAKLYQ
jgi:hypothetical protein